MQAWRGAALEAEDRVSHLLHDVARQAHGHVAGLKLAAVIGNHSVCATLSAHRRGTLHTVPVHTGVGRFACAPAKVA